MRDATTEAPATAALRAVLRHRVLRDRFPVDPAAPAAPPGAVLGVSAPQARSVVADGLRQVFGDDGPLPHPLPMTTGTCHDVGSLTKAVGTTSALMALVDQGAVDLDAPVRSYLPSAGGTWLATVTCRQLLRHRAGLWEWWPAYLSASSAGEALDVVLSLDARYPVDAGRHYSDLGFMLLGAVVSAVTASSLDAAIAALVLRPVGMDGTRYARPALDDVAAGAAGDVVERRMLLTGEPYPVPVRGSDFDGWRTRVRLGEVDDGNAFFCYDGIAGHAGLFSTASDLLRWGESLLASGAGEGPWSRDTVDAFLAPGPDQGQRLGLRSWTDASNGCAVAAFGHPGFPGTVAAVVPEHRATVVLLTNRLHVPDPTAAVATDPMWCAVLHEVHSLLHDPTFGEG